MKKIKSLDDHNEYCLVEQIESEILPLSTLSSAHNDNLNNTSTLNSTSTCNNITNNKHVTTQSTYTTGTLSTTLSSYIKTNSSASGGTSKLNQPKSITKTRVLNASDNLHSLTNTWNKLKLEKKDGFKQAKVILVKKKALQAASATNSLNSNKTHSKISASFAKVAAKSSNLHNIVSASLASANLSYFASAVLTSTHNNAGGTTTKSSSSSAAALSAMYITKSSSNRLVRQKSFDESFENINEKNRHKKEAKVK